MSTRLHVYNQKVSFSSRFSFQIVEKSSNHVQIQVHIWDLFHSNMPKSRNLDTFPNAVDVLDSSYSRRGGGHDGPMRGKWPISQPFVVRFSKFFCLVEAFENPH